MTKDEISAQADEFYSDLLEFINGKNALAVALMFGRALGEAVPENAKEGFTDTMLSMAAMSGPCTCGKCADTELPHGHVPVTYTLH